MQFQTVRPGVQTVSLPDADATATLVSGSKAALLVDTGASPAVGARLREAAARATDRPLATVIVTHGHWDHSFGLAAFADLDTIGAELVADDMACRENRAWAADAGLRPDQLATPATRLGLIGVRDLGGVTVEIAHLGPAHSRSDLILAIPQLSLLIVGDLVEDGPPQFDETSSFLGWMNTLDALNSMLHDDTVIIPGHGHPLGPDDVARFRSGCATIWDTADWAYTQGIPEDEVYDRGTLEWPWDRGVVEQGVAVAYRELAAREQAARERPTPV